VWKIINAICCSFWASRECEHLFRKNVGAIIDRPPKNYVFRISRREITVFFRLAATDFAQQNPRAIDDRPYTRFLARGGAMHLWCTFVFL
jgi:hypothetical protein